MRAVFIHDHYFVYDEANGKYYDGSGGVFNYELWNRYLAVFEHLTIIGREKKIASNKLVESSARNVDFVLISEIKSGIDRFSKAKAIKDKIGKVIAEADFVIIRVPSTLGYLALSVCKQLNKPYMLEVVGCPWDAYWNYGSLTAKIMAPLEMLKLKTVTGGASAVVYVTDRFLQQRYPTKGLSIAISNVNIKETVGKGPAIEYYKSYDSNQDVFRIGLIGSFHVKYKGHIEALNAIKAVIDDYKISNIKLLLVGTGSPQWIENEIKGLAIESYVEIIGTLQAGNNGVLPFLNDLHLYIHPSRQEGLPRVVIEAMSRGKLSLASSVAGTPELLPKECLHQPGDWKKLAHDIAEIYKNRDSWAKVVEDNIETARRYQEDVLQTKRLNFIKKVLNQHHTA